MRGRRTERFAGLDLLRGIAALAVLALHLPWPAAFGAPLPRAYLAVDLFFLLSGFVISHAYSQQLGTTAQFRQYCVARLIRLYPLYCAATLISAVEFLAYLQLGRGADPNVTGGSLAASLATAIVFLPTPPRWSVDPLNVFPLVFTAWSLLWELWVNLIYGAARVLLRPIVLALIMAAGAAGIAFAEHLYGVAGGTTWDGFWVGGARALFSYFAGVALFRVHRRYRAPPVPALLIGALLLLAFVPGTFGGGSAYDMGCIALLFPLLVWFGADAALGPRIRAVGNFVGFLSYPVYLLQAPFLIALAPFWTRIERISPGVGALKVLIDAIAILLGSWVVARWLDQPLRAWLRDRVVPRAPIPRAQSAP